MTSPLAQTALILGLFAAVVASFGAVGRWVDGKPITRRRATRRAVPPVELTHRRPLQVVAADVRRLSRQVALVPAGAPMARRKGLWAAYDDVLVEAAELLDVPHTLNELPGLPSRKRDVERLRLVSALKRAGLVVSD